MYICACHPFNDKAVNAHCAGEGAGKTIRLLDVYKACSGGHKPNCGKCLETLADMVRKHNTRSNVTHEPHMPDAHTTPGATITPQSPTTKTLVR